MDPKEVEQAGGKKRVKTTKKAPKAKKGGALVDDMKNLAVPFAILLAKYGIESMTDKSKDKPVKKSKGGDCKTCSHQGPDGDLDKKKKAPKKGGKADQDMKKRFTQVANEIDAFLAKY
jgi:hypothetical protein